MKKVSLKIFSVFGFLTLAATAAFGASVCPIMSGGNAGGGGGVNPTYVADSGVTNGGCNVLITFNADGSISTTYPNAAMSYDNGGDDNLLGIVNNTGSALGSVTVSGPTAPFGFDGDGACDPTWTFAGGNPCGTTTSGYGHDGVTFSGISTDTDSGTIDFSPGIAANGGTNWVSLEGPVSLALVVTSGNATPEPATNILLGTGMGLILFGVRRLRAKGSV